MGFWNVEARDLRLGDEIRMMGGAEYAAVRDVDTISISDRVRVRLDWDRDTSGEPFWAALKPDELMVVRR